jgi:hypothetical protein
MLNSILNVAVSDTTGDDSSNAVGYIKTFMRFSNNKLLTNFKNPLLSTVCSDLRHREFPASKIFVWRLRYNSHYIYTKKNRI